MGQSTWGLAEGLSPDMDYDKILIQLGEFGWWQRRNALLLWLPALAAGVNVLIAAFAVMEPRYSYRCRLECEPEGDISWRLPSNLSPGQLYPSLDQSNEEEFDPDKPDYCQHYRTFLSGESCQVDNSTLVKCKRGDEFVYEDFEMKHTVAIDNDLVCDDYFWTIVIDEFFMLGLLIGSFVFGVLSDKIGRRHTLLLAILSCAVGNLLGVAMPNHWSYAIPRILASAGGEGAFVLAFTMSLEYSGVRERVPCFPWVTWSTMLSNIIGLPFALGESLPPLFAMGLKDWKTFQAAVSSLVAFSCIVWFFLPESPRWLIANGKKEEAKKVVEAAAAVNNVKLTPDVFLPDEEEDKAGAEVELPVYGLKDMFRKSQLRITLAMFICWPVITMLYYGLSLSADKIHMTDNVYLSYILVSLIEMPAYIFLPLIIDVWGRKPVFFTTQLVPGICCIVAAFLKPGTFFYTILALGAKLGAAAAFNVTFMYTAQLYPTSIRNSAVGTCSTIARVGGMLAPIIGKFLIELGKIPEEVPLCLFGGFGVIGALCSLMLPDSVGFPLPNTFEDIEEIKKKSKPFFKCHTGAAED